MTRMVHHAQNLGMNEHLTPRMRSIVQMFGVSIGEHNISAPVIEMPRMSGGILLVTGPSGCGKTTLLRHWISSDVCQLACDSLAEETRAVIDCFDLPLCDALTLLARCGLSEAGIWLKKTAELSQGQRYRFELARCLASPKPIIMADEFCSVLDRTVACIICWQMRKLISQLRKTLVAATAHEDIAQDLEPDHWLQMDLGGRAKWQKGGGHVHDHQSHQN